MGETTQITAGTLAELLGESSGSSAALHACVRGLVLDGRLVPGTRLPAERELSEAIGVSRTLVARALDLLRADGFVASRRGAYSWITLPGRGSWIPPTETRSLNLAQAVPTAPPELGAALDRARLRLAEELSGHGYQGHGLPALRERVAEWFQQRGLPTSPEQIVITNGAQNAFAHLLRLLVSNGQRVLFEHPTYPNALEAIGHRGAAVPVPMTEDGWDPDAIEAAIHQTSPRLAYLIPDFQNPTGLRMSAEVRERVTAILRKTRTLAVVDETLVDIDLSATTPPPPMAAFAEEHVLTIGSSSKSFWGGLRLGWIRAPEELIRKLLLSRSAIDLGSPVLEQLTLAELLADPQPILRRRRSESIERRDRLAAALGEHLPNWTFRLPEGGLSLWCDLGDPIGTKLAVAAEQHGLLLAPGSRFGVHDSLERYLRLPYTLPADDLNAAVERLALVASGTAPGPGALEAPVA